MVECKLDEGHAGDHDYETIEERDRRIPLPDQIVQGLSPLEYVAANLEAALALVPDTGDWHGQLRHWCARWKGDCKPNQSVEAQRLMMERARIDPTETKKLVEAEIKRILDSSTVGDPRQAAIGFLVSQGADHAWAEAHVIAASWTPGGGLSCELKLDRPVTRIVGEFTVDMPPSST